MIKILEFESKPLHWWIDQFALIDMSPSYQRAPGVWSSRTKSYLIDSIINGYDLPKFYIADLSGSSQDLDEQQTKQYAVVDGRQRLEAIADFSHGDLRLLDDFVFLERPEYRLGGKTYRELLIEAPDVAARFSNFFITVMRVFANNREQIEDLFVRLNQSVPLNSAEIRNARPGLIPPLIRKLTSHPLFTDRVAFSRKRGEDKTVATKLMLMEERHGFVDLKKANLDRFVEQGNLGRSYRRREPDESSEYQLLFDRVALTLDRMAQVFKHRDSLLDTQGLLPIYYWVIREAPVPFGRIRDGLAAFKHERSENRMRRNRFGVESQQTDRQLDEFDRLNWDANRRLSLEPRYRIVVEFLRKWCDSKA